MVKPSKSASRQRKDREDWSHKGFYKTMLFVYRPDRKKSTPLNPPFFKNRPLTPSVFWAICKMCILARLKEFDRRLNEPKNRKAHSILLEEQMVTLRDNFPNLAWQEDIQLITTLGRLYFADTVEKQRQAKKEIRALAMRARPVELRPYLKRFDRSTSPVKRRFSLLTEQGNSFISPFRSFLAYYAERQFVWEFLRQEGMAAFKCSRYELRRSAAHVAKPLAKEYSFLRLTLEQIKHGLDSRYPADEDVAEEFCLSPASVRSTISKYL